MKKFTVYYVKKYFKAQLAGGYLHINCVFFKRTYKNGHRIIKNSLMIFILINVHRIELSSSLRVFFSFICYDYNVVGGYPQIDCVLRIIRTYEKDHV